MVQYFINRWGKDLSAGGASGSWREAKHLLEENRAVKKWRRKRLRHSCSWSHKPAPSLPLTRCDRAAKSLLTIKLVWLVLLPPASAV